MNNNNLSLAVSEKKQKALVEFLLFNTRLTHEGLADMLDVSPSDLARVENGVGKLDKRASSILLECFCIFIEG